MLTDKTRIEFARLADLDEISRISRDQVEFGLGWQYTMQRLTRLITDHSKNLVVARADKTLIGFGIMTYRGDQANLDLLAVKGEYQRMKIGTQIVMWLEKVARTMGSFNVFVQVRKINSGAIRFYKTLDFLELEVIEGYYKGVEKAVILVKMLAPMNYAN